MNNRNVYKSANWKLSMRMRNISANWDAGNKSGDDESW